MRERGIRGPVGLQQQLRAQHRDTMLATGVGAARGGAPRLFGATPKACPQGELVSALLQAEKGQIPVLLVEALQTFQLSATGDLQ